MRIGDRTLLIDRMQAVGALKHIPPGSYHVCVISESTYNLFTPLLRTIRRSSILCCI